MTAVQVGTRVFVHGEWGVVDEVDETAHMPVRVWLDSLMPMAMTMEAAVESAMAAVVRELAESIPWQGDYCACVFCNQGPPSTFDSMPPMPASPIEHKPECLWLRARKLCGMEGA